MKLIRRPLFQILGAALLIAYSSVIYAQSTGTSTGSTSSGGGAPFPDFTITEPNAFGASGEGINVQAVDSNEITAFTTQTGTTGSENLQGCAGVGQAEYTSGVFNMPEVFNKFKQDVNTDLAKQLLTYNYSLPQTAALFETLNTYGNQRYQQFLQGCSLDDLKKDARKQYLDACIKKVGSSSSSTGTDGEKYARAWEICTAMYSSQQTSGGSGIDAAAQRKEENEKFAKLMRSTENVNKYITPLMCATSSNSTASSCWAMFFLPQVAICNGKDFQDGCGDGTKYGVKPAPLSMRTFFDALRTILNQELITKVVNDLNSKIATAGLNYNLQVYAATQAVNALRQGSGTTTTGTTTVEDAFKNFQTNYLNCQNKDATNNLKEYVKQLNQANPGDTNPASQNANATTNISLQTFQLSNIQNITSKLSLSSVPNTSENDLPKLAEIALGCTINQTIPMLDPVITAQLSTACNANDRQAFYALASHDVALTATRDVYRYLSTQLKQVRARLQTEPLKDSSSSNSSDAPDSPELRRRLAEAITNVMLPTVESQLERINELEKTRGQFAKRVEKIYATKQGCVYQTGQGNLPTN